MNTKLNLFKVTFLSIVFAFTACSDDEEDEPAPVQQNQEPIELSCDYFSENSNVVLEDDPNAPIDYIIDCSTVDISDDVTIEPGVTIAFRQDAGIRVMSNGSLNAVGTAEKPITLTATDQQKGWWRGVEFNSSNEKNEVAYATIEYAGSNGDAALSISNSATLDLSNSSLQKCSETGLFIETRGLSGSDQDRVDAVMLDGNTYTENESPMSIPFYMLSNLDVNSSYAGNDQDLVYIHSRQMRGVSVSMKELGIPYRTTGRLHISDGGGDPSHLTIEAGVELEMAAGSNIIVFGGTNYLTAIGTQNEPIIIRGADQNPGTWENIIINRSGPAAYNHLEHVEIIHASADVNNHAGVLNLDFINNTLKLTLNDVHFSNFSGTNCPIEYSGDLSGLTSSNLSDDEGKLPGCL